MMLRPMRRPSIACAAAAALIVVLALAVTGCGSVPVAPVRVLQMGPPTVVAKRAAAGANLPVRVSLSAPAGATVAPPVYVPQVGSIATGKPHRGRLINGLALPPSGPDWIALKPKSHLWTTDRMLAFLLAVLRDYRLANPGVPQVMIGDLSRRTGGRFRGHASHQNGLDVDVYYPRLDRTLRAPRRVADVDRVLAQDLVNRFVASGAQFTFVGLRLGLVGPRAVVQAIPHHNDHVHVRIANLVG
jgi:hypothetical protein